MGNPITHSAKCLKFKYEHYIKDRDRVIPYNSASQITATQTQPSQQRMSQLRSQNPMPGIVENENEESESESEASSSEEETIAKRVHFRPRKRRKIEFQT